MEGGRPAGVASGYAFPPQRAQLLRGPLTRGKWREVFIFLGVDLWWVEAEEEENCPELFLDEFRKIYRSTWKDVKRRKGYFQLHRGMTTVEVDDGGGAAAEDGESTKKTLKVKDSEHRFLKIELDRDLADTWEFALRVRVTRWKDLIAGEFLLNWPKEPTELRYKSKELTAGLQNALDARGTSNMDEDVLEDGSTLLRMASYAIGRVADLRHLLSKLAGLCSSLEVQNQGAIWLPLIDSGLGLVDTIIDLCKDIAEIKSPNEITSWKSFLKPLTYAFDHRKSSGKSRGILTEADDWSSVGSGMSGHRRTLTEDNSQAYTDASTEDRVEEDKEASTLAKRLLQTFIRLLENKEYSFRSKVPEKLDAKLNRLEKHLRLLEEYVFKNFLVRSGVKWMIGDGLTRVTGRLRRVSTEVDDLKISVKAESISPFKEMIGKFFSIPQLPDKANLDSNLDSLRDSLLGKESGSAVAAVAAFDGVGRTTKMIQVANDSNIKKEFNDVLWVQLSQNMTEMDMRQVILNLIRYAEVTWDFHAEESLIYPHTPLETIFEEAEKAYEKRKCLVILDDFSRFKRCGIYIKHLTKILRGPSRILVSTKIECEDLVEQFGAHKVPMDGLDRETANALFDTWSGREPKDEEDQCKEKILDHCSDLALAVRIAGACAKRLMSCDEVLEYLRERADDSVHPSLTVQILIRKCLDSIENNVDREAYCDLAVFERNRKVPNQALEALWDADYATVENRVNLYLECSLATRKDETPINEKSYYVEFHDCHLQYARNICRTRELKQSGTLAQIHDRLAKSYKKLGKSGTSNNWWEDERLDDGYFYRNCVRHLVNSGTQEARDQLKELLLSYSWIAILIGHSIEVHRILADFNMAISLLEKTEKIRTSDKNAGSVKDAISDNERQLEALKLVQGALRSAQLTLCKGRTELAFQLLERLRNFSANPQVERFINGAWEWEKGPWLCPMTQFFESPKCGPLTVLPAASAVESVAACGDTLDIIACGTRDGTIQLWNAENSYRLNTLHGHGDWVTSVVITEDGERIVSGSYDKTVRVWSMDSGELEMALRGHEDMVESVAVTVDGRYVVSGSRDETVRIWDTLSGDFKELRGHGYWVSSVALTKNGKYIVSGSREGTVRVWSVESQSCEKVLRGYGYWVNSVAVAERQEGVAPESHEIKRQDSLKCDDCIASSSHVIVSGSRGKNLVVWSMESGRSERILREDEAWAESVAITNDGKHVVSGDVDGAIRVWNIESGDRERILCGHADVVKSVVLTRDGNYIVSGSLDKTVRVWRRASESCEDGGESFIASVAVTEDGSQIISGSSDGRIRVWSTETGILEQELLGHKNRVTSLAVTEDGKYVVSGSRDKTLRVWHVKSRKEKVLFRDKGWVLSLALTADGKHVLSGSSDGIVRFWSIESGKCKELRGHRAQVVSVTVTEDGSRIISGSHDKTVRIWEVQSDYRERLLDGHQACVESVTLTKDEKYIVSGSRDKTVRVWSMESANCVRVLNGHQAWVESVTVTEDGEYIVSGSRNGTVRVWNLASGSCENVLPRAWSSLYATISKRRKVLSFLAGESTHRTPGPELFGNSNYYVDQNLEKSGDCVGSLYFIGTEGTTVRIGSRLDGEEEIHMQATFDHPVTIFTTSTRGHVAVCSGNAVVILKATCKTSNH